MLLYLITGRGQAQASVAERPIVLPPVSKGAVMKGHIAIARDHVVKGRAIVARQRNLIAEIRAHRRDPALAEDLLVRFEASLRIFEQDLERLEADWPEAAPGG